MYKLYEIYTKHPETGEGGWTIEFIWALSREDAATYPLFDCVTIMEGRADNLETVLRSGYGYTDAVYKR